MFRTAFALVTLSLLTVVALLETAAAAEPYSSNPNSPQVVSERRKELKAEIKAEIKSMDIHERPNRPGHFYGNTVRRRSARNS